MEFSIKSSGISQLSGNYSGRHLGCGCVSCGATVLEKFYCSYQCPCPRGAEPLLLKGQRPTSVTVTYRGSQVAILSIFLQEFLILIWFCFSFLVFRIIGFYDTDRRGIFTHLRALEKLEPSLKLPAPLPPTPRNIGMIQGKET